MKTGDEFSLHEKTRHCMLVVAFTSIWKLSGKFTKCYYTGMKNKHLTLTNPHFHKAEALLPVFI